MSKIFQKMTIGMVIVGFIGLSIFCCCVVNTTYAFEEPTVTQEMPSCHQTQAAQETEQTNECDCPVMLGQRPELAVADIVLKIDFSPFTKEILSKPVSEIIISNRIDTFHYPFEHHQSIPIYLLTENFRI